MHTYAAEGATIVVPAPDKAYFEKDLKTPHTVAPDAYQKNKKLGISGATFGSNGPQSGLEAIMAQK
jgi:hypothetical protein